MSAPLPSVQLADPANWVKGDTGFMREDGPCCMVAAIRRAFGPATEIYAGDSTHPDYLAAKLRLADHVGTSALVTWNDAPARTHAEVIAALKAVGL